VSPVVTSLRRVTTLAAAAQRCDPPHQRQQQPEIGLEQGRERALTACALLNARPGHERLKLEPAGGRMVRRKPRGTRRRTASSTSPEAPHTAGRSRS